MGRRQEQTLRRYGWKGLESSVALFSVSCQPYRLVPMWTCDLCGHVTYVDREGSACVFDVCHKRNRVPVLSGVPAPLFMKTCHSFWMMIYTVVTVLGHALMYGTKPHDSWSVHI